MKVAVLVDMPESSDVEASIKEVMGRMIEGGLVVTDFEVIGFPNLSTRVFCSGLIQARHPRILGGLDDGAH